MTKFLWGVAAVLASASPASLVWAQSSPVIAGVYTCTDAKGRKLTSDRPIPECTDREQKVLNPSGTVKAKVGPTLTAHERAELEQKQKREREELGRAAEEKRRDRALLTRYPNRAMHDKERQEAIAGINTVINAAALRLTELANQRKQIENEMEFYKNDPSKAPAYLRRQQDENIQSQAIQIRFINEQRGEVDRVNGRFDDELVRLKQLWTTISK